MSKLILAAGVAAMAISLPAAAKPGGGGHGGGQQAQHGGGGEAKAQRGGGQKADRGGGGERALAQQPGGGGGGRQMTMERHGGGGRQMTMERRGGGGRQAQAFERRGGGQQRQAQRIERGGGGQRFANFQSERGHGGQKAQREHGNGGNQRIAVQERGHGKAQQFERRGGQQDVRMAKGGHGNHDFRQENRSSQRLAMEQKGHGKQRFQIEDRGNQRLQVESRRGGDRMAFANGDWGDRNQEFVERVRGDRFYDPRSYDRVHNTTLFVDRGIPAAYVGGCPPGLAKKSPACVPPGLARTEFVGRVLPDAYASSYIPRDLRYLYNDTPDYYYRWGDGYVYRVNRTNNLVAGILPLIGAGYGIGQPFPYMGNPYYSVPTYYQSFYPDTPYDYYRYDDGYVYRVDAGTGYIEDVIPLLDRGYGVGQMMPVSYSYYNVPYQYRDVYYDTPDYYYRYAPGAIYQVDRESQLITSIASLLTGGLAVGQPLPAAYSVYNVPMAYRPTYYDTPDSWYRYSDGYIYQVDPTTQLITAIVRAIV